MRNLNAGKGKVRVNPPTNPLSLLISAFLCGLRVSAFIPLPPFACRLIRAHPCLLGALPLAQRVRGEKCPVLLNARILPFLKDAPATINGC